MEGHIAQHGTALVIGKGHVIEDDVAVNLLLDGILFFGKYGVRIENRPNASTANAVWAMELFMLPRSFTGLKKEQSKRKKDSQFSGGHSFRQDPEGPRQSTKGTQKETMMKRWVRAGP